MRTRRSARFFFHIFLRMKRVRFIGLFLVVAGFNTPAVKTAVDGELIDGVCRGGRWWCFTRREVVDITTVVRSQYIRIL